MPKAPPTFRHFPEQRAKKLKQAWVQNKKIKAKWRAEKQKLHAEDTAPEEAPDPEPMSERKAVQVQGAAASKPGKLQPVAKNFSVQPDRPPPVDQSSRASLRERTREAYSSSSLHTYKSNPLGRTTQNKGRPGIKGKGQPNMKLRMGVLLEQIQQSYTT